MSAYGDTPVASDLRGRMALSRRTRRHRAARLQRAVRVVLLVAGERGAEHAQHMHCGLRAQAVVVLRPHVVESAGFEHPTLSATSVSCCSTPPKGAQPLRRPRVCVRTWRFTCLVSVARQLERIRPLSAMKHKPWRKSGSAASTMPLFHQPPIQIGISELREVTWLTAQIPTISPTSGRPAPIIPHTR